MNPINARSFRFVLALCALALTALPAAAQNEAEQQNSIQAVNVSTAPGGKLVLTVTMKNALPSLPRDFSVSTPPRIAFDFPNTVSELAKATQEFDQGSLRSISVVQAGSRSRLVVNLTQPMSYTSRIEGSNLIVTLSSVSGAGSASRFAEALPGTPGHTLRDIDFRRGPNGEGRIEVALSDSGVGIDIRREGKRLVVDFIKTSAPRALQRKLDVTDFGTPVSLVDTFAQGSNVRMVVEPTGQWEQVAYQADNRFVLEIKRKAVEEEGKKGAKPEYSGDKLTLNFQNIQVREALNVIADFTGLNIVISDSVTGNLTLRLKDVPWDQALDIILQSKNLDKRQSGNVIRIAPREELAAADKLRMSAEQDVVDLEPLRTESFQLSYQKGEDIANLLSSGTQRILSKRGSAVVDKRTNILFVQDTPSRLEDVRALIKQIDIPVRQVMIEARFVSAGTQFNRNLGAKLSFTSFNQYATPVGPVGPVMAGGAGGLPAATPNGTTIAKTIQTGQVVSANTLSFAMFDPSMTKLLQLELNASEIDGTTKNIASPRVVTADKTAATISSGTQIPYQQATSSGATSIAFVSAALTLNVTPQITPDDHIDMRLAVNQDSVGTIYAGTPSINSRRVTTQVLVENGGTVVIGGVYTQDVSDSTTKIPLLGDLPVIGWLFKNKVATDNKNELLIFITPKIMKENLNLD